MTPFYDYRPYLDLHFRQTMLPDDDIRCDSIFAVIQEDDPVRNHVSSYPHALNRIEEPLTFHQGP